MKPRITVPAVAAIAALSLAPAAERVIPIPRDDLEWGFRGLPTALLKSPHRSFPISTSVDPFPGYPHDPALVAECAAAVEAAFPVGFLPRYYLLPCEEDGRTNGYANRDMLYNIGREEFEKPHPFDPYITLGAKRIPIHPAMTRYLVAHEYGHVVQWWMEYLMGIEDHGTLSKLSEEYARLRGMEATERYGGGRWHLAPGELFANDFRILVARAEVEFWPHPGLPRPEELPAVVEFWERAVAEFTWRPDAVAEPALA